MKFFINNKDLDFPDRVMLLISYMLQLVLLAAIFIFISEGNWFNCFLTVTILFLSFLPAIIRRSYKVYLPVEFDLFTILFLFLATFLGESNSFYNKFWWWDIILHISSGFLLGIMGFLLVYVLSEEKTASLKMKPIFISLFAFSFAIMLGTIWEIYEFGNDQLLGTNMQKSGLIDTMWDLIVDTIGALVVSIIGYFYINKNNNKSLLFDRMVRRFIEKNYHLFIRRRT